MAHATNDQIFKLIAQEEVRQREELGLIPSENHISPEVASVLSSCLNSKYSEGYPNRRYYEGNRIVDLIELEAQARIKELFGVPYVNVQPYSGSPANSAIQFALLNPGDTIMGLQLTMGGHLTHGHPDVTFSGRYFKSVQFGVDSRARIDFDQALSLAKKHKPKVIFAGTTAYPFALDFKAFRAVADAVGAWLVADISHITGLVVGGMHASPVPEVDVVMSTTHKTFRGPRGAMIMVTPRGLARDPDLGKKIDMAIIPGLQGGPHNATTAGIAVAAAEAKQAKFTTYAKRVVANAAVLAEELQHRGLKLVGGGTENHLMVMDLTELSPGLGTQVAVALDVMGIYANRNTVPQEQVSPFYPSGVRLGTPLITTRGMRRADMKRIAAWIAVAVHEASAYPLPKEKSERSGFIKKYRTVIARNKVLKEVRKEIATFAQEFPLFTW